MAKPIPTIPHAREAYAVGRMLHVVIDLMHDSALPGFHRTAHEEMMFAVQRLTEDLDHNDPFANLAIHSPDQPSWPKGPQASVAPLI